MIPVGLVKEDEKAMRVSSEDIVQPCHPEHACISKWHDTMSLCDAVRTM